ncbi:39S ribosomal protein L2, mitochondrial [Strongylocentrotus purpuratus]|uniref:39S ribosomal protein L2, mitochondrial n=1 Tax=Strongylocentrotus purpuratus TaxID=7668 RepID=A0A7M7NR91_STRPU|nr:39S ribosomal protein L2, mitochondrial [Strongylocentrotus purpuratus]
MMSTRNSIFQLCNVFRTLTLSRNVAVQTALPARCSSLLSTHKHTTLGLSHKVSFSSLVFRASTVQTLNVVEKERHRDFHTSLTLERFKPWKKTPEYTLRPLGKKRITSRDHTGRVVSGRRGGGAKRNYRMVDFKRVGPVEGPPMEEKVLAVRYDPNRTANIAIVAGGNKKRYIIASANMEPGDIIRTSGHIGRMTVVANEGDAYPLGALPIGSLVHCVEIYPGEGAIRVRSGGTSAQILRKVGGQVILQLPSKLQISVNERCVATVGRASGDQHNRMVIGKAGRSRWFGRRPSSGLWQRKGGWAGRKIKPLPPIKVYMDPSKKGTHITV